MTDVYFTASIVGKKRYLNNYLRIISALKKKGYHVLADHIIYASEDKIDFQKKEERLKFHKKLESWIGSAAFMVVESTFPSISVGYEISLALSMGKHILVLYESGTAPALLAAHKDEKIVCEKYSVDSLTDIIDDFVNFVHSTSDQRFTFFITPEINRYLQDVAKKEKLPKSVYLRKLIETDMEKRRSS